LSRSTQSPAFMFNAAISAPLMKSTRRSHDQYNTTIYGLDDRYRGVFGERRVLFINGADIAALNMKAGDWVDLE
ncbi:molybdopterin dinucleotide binding domain-containing protein, partial [Xanthomonas arboricola]|uniref:molybdopterin dinucleotide binding domain-containing protein n=1 Tax=Xanthomonas arboricola TaxID=56448 RepID=UPI0021583C61